eukprot:12714841-Prorocentrum_lima.AAC.1
MIRRPPRSTHCISSAVHTAYRRQRQMCIRDRPKAVSLPHGNAAAATAAKDFRPVSYTHLRAHETR